MAHYSFEAPLDVVEGMLTSLLDEQGYVYVDSHVYVVADGERPSGPHLFCIVRDPDDGDTWFAEDDTPPRGITAVDPDGDIEAFNRWAREVDAEAGVDIQSLRSEIIE